MSQVIDIAYAQVINSSAEALDIPHLVMGILQLKESWACYLLKDALGSKESNFMSELISAYEFSDHLEEETGEHQHEAAWRRLVTCMNDLYQNHNPLIGREQELTRTIQVLCRRDKNNPLHVGEPGVGKTALIWGLARMVPERLKGSRIYQLDIGTLLAGTQYRGDFEHRIKQIMDGIQEESDKNIVYIDEIHTLVGAGATGEGSMSSPIWSQATSASSAPPPTRNTTATSRAPRVSCAASSRSTSLNRHQRRRNISCSSCARNTNSSIR